MLFKNSNPGPSGNTDWRGIIAVLVLACTFGLTAIQIFRGVPVEEAIPQWATTLVGIIATFYYVSKGHEEAGNGHEEYKEGRRDAEDEVKRQTEAFLNDPRQPDPRP